MAYRRYRAIIFFDLVHSALSVLVDDEGAKMTAASSNSVGGEMFYIRCDVRDEQNIKVL